MEENEKEQDILALINKVFDKYTDTAHITSDELPNIDLYVDQITTLMTRELSDTLRYEDDKIMTKTMINNYTKNHLLPPPDKKKYSKDHILLLIFIYYFKNFMSIGDIHTLLEPLTQTYFHKEGPDNLSTIYDTLFSKKSDLAKRLEDYIREEYEMTKDLFSEETTEDAEYLQKFAFICINSLDIYIRKQLIEQILDNSL